MQILCVIPARLGASRLPHKPLRLLAGKPLVRWVAEHALELEVADRVVVATDDGRVLDAVAGLAVEATLTDGRHRSGTERVAEVAGRAEYRRFDAVLSIQGDQPFLPRGAAEGALDRVQRGDPMATAGAPLQGSDSVDPNRVKVVVDDSGRALRFARTLPASTPWSCGVSVLHHIGIYVFRMSVLEQWMKWSPVPGEISEGLEQLRPMHYGVPIGVALVEGPVRPPIDTECDLAEAEAYVGMFHQRMVS